MFAIAKPFLDEDEIRAAAEAISSGWISQGPRVKQFENDFAKYVGAEFACAVSNCTAALHLAMLAAGVTEGDEVITASHSFIATANAICYCGGVPVFVDIDLSTFNMTARHVEEAVTSKTRAILCVHQIGMPCEIEAIAELGKRLGIPVIEDAACAVGSEVQVGGEWEKIGRPHGDAACFSFHPRKVMTTGEGGMITTRNEEWDEKFRLLRQHGMSVSDIKRHASGTVIFERYPIVGFNYRMTDIQAAIGIVQLSRLPDLVAQRREIAARYERRLKDVPGVAPPQEPPWARSNWQSYCVRLPDLTQQREVMQAMLVDGVATRRGVMCSHREGPYLDNGRRAVLRNSEIAQDRHILLPIYVGLSEEDQEEIVTSLRRACETELERRGAC